MLYRRSLTLVGDISVREDVLMISVRGSGMDWRSGLRRSKYVFIGLPKTTKDIVIETNYLADKIVFGRPWFMIWGKV